MSEQSSQEPTALFIEQRDEEFRKQIKNNPDYKDSGIFPTDFEEARKDIERLLTEKRDKHPHLSHLDPRLLQLFHVFGWCRAAAIFYGILPRISDSNKRFSLFEEIQKLLVANGIVNLGNYKEVINKHTGLLPEEILRNHLAPISNIPLVNKMSDLLFKELELDSIKK